MDNIVTPENPVLIGRHWCGKGQPLLLIAGPCVIEEANWPKMAQDWAVDIAQGLKDICDHCQMPLIFKASWDKANRSAVGSYRGVGLDQGKAVLKKIREDTGLAVTTDIHEPWHADAMAEVCDLLQIPALLCRQTDLLLAAGCTGKPVHVKKGQFMAPGQMVDVISKLMSVDCRRILLGERGTFFGYGRLVNDFEGMMTMRRMGAPVIFDATHSIQRQDATMRRTIGDRSMISGLALAAVAAGVDGLFLETHPDPDNALCDGPNMLSLNDLPRLLERVQGVRVGAGWDARNSSPTE